MKIGNKNINKKVFNNKTVLKEVLNGSIIYENPYLIFNSNNSFTLEVVDHLKYWDGTLEYSTDTTTWNTWDGTTVLSSVNNKLYLRGTGNSYITGNNDIVRKARWVLTGSNISCRGNIENLLDYATVTNGQHPVMANYCYNGLFYNCSNLISTPELPATTLTDYCYSYMFYGCSNLTTAMNTLPALTLTLHCYEEMFYECSGLINAPNILATSTSTYCCSNMFRNCTSLTTVPELKTTILTNYCYYQMFRGCTSLTVAPSLSATTLAISCYQEMFYGCTNLITIPELPAITLANYCYYYMFNGCSKIKLSETQTGEYMQEYRIPTTDTGTTATMALFSMFYNTGGTFTSTPTINTTYYLSNTNTIV